jgi:hypothetical protein
MQHRVKHSRVQRSLFLVGALMVAALGHAQNINVTAANASSDAIGTVNFINQTFNVQNQDQGSLHSIRSLVFISNPSSLQLDLLAADNAGGEIVRYCGDFNQNASPPANTSGVVVWNQTEGGPTSPDGLSVDSAGNLFLVNQGSGTSTTPQLWVMQQLSSCVNNPPAPTSVLIDSNYGAKETLEETLVAGTTIPLPKGAPVAQINPGDLLVLTTNPAYVLLYPGSNGHGPMGPTTPFTLIKLPPGTQPGGMAFWPVDNSLLVTTGTGTIFQYTVANLMPNGTPGTFVSGLGNGQFKVKTGRQDSSAIPVGLRSASLSYAFVADNNGGRLLEFNDQGVLISTVTTGVQHPQGLAVTNTAYQQFASCFQDPNVACNVLGGNGAHPLLNHKVTAQVTGNILEDVCVVPTDPRVAQYGSCTAAASAPKSPYANGLPIAQVCGAGFDNPLNPLVIPNSMCGATAGSGFALIKTKTQAYSDGQFPLNGTFVENDSQFSGLPSGPNDPVCPFPAGNPPPFAVQGWAPLAGEGVGAGGHSLMDTTNGCDTHSGTGTFSLTAVGLGLNTGVIPGGLVGFATTEYTNLLGTLAAEDSAGEGALTPASSPAATPPFGNFTFQLQQCIQTSQGAFLAGSANYSGAAVELLTADYNVFANAPAQPGPVFTGPFTPNVDYPNPSGLLRQLLQTTSFTVGVRLAGGDSTPPAQPPLQPSPPLPTITGNPNTSIKAGQHYSFNPTSADFAGNTKTLTYSLAGLPWATLSPAKKNNQVQVTGTAPAVPGNYNPVVLTVSDGCTTNFLQWSVTVTP